MEHPHPDYLCVTAHYFGWGDNPNEAKANCRKAGGAKAIKRYGYVLYNVPEGTEISTITGHITWDRDKGDIVEIENTLTT